jgi:hypothetical protein
MVFGLKQSMMNWIVRFSESCQITAELNMSILGRLLKRYLDFLAKVTSFTPKLRTIMMPKVIRE